MNVYYNECNKSGCLIKFTTKEEYYFLGTVIISKINFLTVLTIENDAFNCFLKGHAAVALELSLGICNSHLVFDFKGLLVVVDEIS